MLRWLLLLTMALLPWHGWAGASIAGALSGTATAIVHHAAHHPGGAAAADRGQADAACLEHAHHAAAQTPEVPETPIAGDASGSCPGCSMCNACSPLALLPDLTVVEPAAFARAAPAARATRFASADRTPGLKPPIF